MKQNRISRPEGLRGFFSFLFLFWLCKWFCLSVCSTSESHAFFNADAYLLITSVKAEKETDGPLYRHRSFVRFGLWQQKHSSTPLLIKSLGLYVHLSHDLLRCKLRVSALASSFCTVYLFLTNNRLARLDWALRWSFEVK